MLRGWQDVVFDGFFSRFTSKWKRKEQDVTESATIHPAWVIFWPKHAPKITRKLPKPLAWPFLSSLPRAPVPMGPDPCFRLESWSLFLKNYEIGGKNCNKAINKPFFWEMLTIQLIYPIKKCWFFWGCTVAHCQLGLPLGVGLPQSLWTSKIKRNLCQYIDRKHVYVYIDR